MYLSEQENWMRYNSRLFWWPLWNHSSHTLYIKRNKICLEILFVSKFNARIFRLTEVPPYGRDFMRFFLATRGSGTIVMTTAWATTQPHDDDYIHDDKITRYLCVSEIKPPHNTRQLNDRAESVLPAWSWLVSHNSASWSVLILLHHSNSPTIFIIN